MPRPQLRFFQGRRRLHAPLRRRADAMDDEGFLDAAADREARIERGEWDPETPSARRAVGGARARAHHVPVDHDLSGRGAFQPDQQVGERALAAAAFAGDAEDASDTYVEADAVDRPHGRGPAEHGHAPGEVLVHVAKGHDWGVTAHATSTRIPNAGPGRLLAHVGASPAK